MIKKSTAYITEDGKMFATLNEASDHSYGRQLRDAMGVNGVFGIKTILEHSRDIEKILRTYNAELDRLDRECTTDAE